MAHWQCTPAASPHRWPRRIPDRRTRFSRSRTPWGHRTSSLTAQRFHIQMDTAELICSSDTNKKQKSGKRYPESALAGAFFAVDAVNPEDVAASVDLDVVAPGRRPQLDLCEVEPARAGTGPAIPTTKSSIPQRNLPKIKKLARAGTYPVSVGRPRPPSGRSAAARRRPWRRPSWTRRALMLAPASSPPTPAGNLRRTWKTPAATAPGPEPAASSSAARRRAASRGGGGAMDYWWVAADGNSKPPARRAATAIIAGGRERSGFGRPEREVGYFSCPPSPLAAAAPPPPRLGYFPRLSLRSEE